MDGTRHGPAKLRVTMAEAAEILGVSVEAAEMIATLLEQVQAERQAHAETRMLLAAALERIPPQLEPPSGRSEAPVSPQEEADPTRIPRPTPTKTYSGQPHSAHGGPVSSRLRSEP
jgi:hypothetical protein